MDWLNKNYFKIGILVAVFVLPYYLYYVPVVLKPERELQKNIAVCNTQGAVFSQQFQEESKQENSNIVSFVAPQYHYSQQRNSCLSEDGYVFPDHGATGTYMVITDIKSNTQILQSVKNMYEQVDQSNGIVTYQEFMTQAPIIMSN